MGRVNEAGRNKSRRTLGQFHYFPLRWYHLICHSLFLLWLRQDTVGHDTTAHTTAYLLYNLVKHPEIMAKVMAEVDSVLGSDQIANHTHIAQMPYLLQCVKVRAF
jgi:hypothetical protein